ncbi:MAG TPA: endonuclease/exonuclease/phosphatase family protein [Kofleriaceae bacterium]|nr:endonuclease/exonuclease/phosphatase family protein [Kofleriaceae bacterium]
MLARIAVVAATSACAACAGGDGSSTPRSAPTATPAAPAAAPAMLLMTYNVNYGVAGDADTIALVRDSGADVVLLQETNAAWERALRPAVASIYPHVAFLHADRRAGGLAFLSRHPIALKEQHASPIGWFPAWRAVVDGPLGRVQLLNLHLRPPGKEDGSYLRGYFSSQAPRLEETLAHLELVDPDLPAILAGDFNEDARGKSVAHLAGLGFVSALDAVRPAHPTWRWTVAGKEIRWQLDHILLPPALRAAEVWVVEGGSSDHMPVMARIQRAP